MSFFVIPIFFVIVLLLGGCTAVGNAYVRGVVDQVKTGADGTAATLDAAMCGKTVGSYFRLPDPRHAAGTKLLCDPNAQMPSVGPSMTFEQWQAITSDVPAPGSR